jgi:hypothetical protein
VAPSWKLSGACLCLTSVWLAGGTLAAVEITDDARVQDAVERARTRYLDEQPFDRLDLVVLLESGEGKWLRGAVNGEQLSYPASCMKLAVLVAAVHWCAEAGRPPQCLDGYVRPMIEVSDNEATGRVIDAITGAANEEPAEAPGYEAWIERRLYVERLLGELKLLGSQRVLTKTYPSNSGEMPTGFEHRAWQAFGRNAMAPDPAARLMLGIVAGEIEPQARDYMRGLLRRNRFTPFSALGPGLPPGTLFESKIGNAYDTLSEIAHIVLPNGRRLVVAAFSNGYDQSEPQPYDTARLGPLASHLVRELALTRGLPWQREFDADHVGLARWQWEPRVAEGGRYELRIWYPARAGATVRARYDIEHATGTTRVEIDQRFWANRWVKLGDFAPGRGRLRVTLSAALPGALSVGRLSVTRWPQEVRADGSIATR